MGFQWTSDGAQAASIGSPKYLGTIDATTTSRTNGQATTPFLNTGDGLKGKILLIVNDGTVNVRILPTATATGVVTVTRGANFGVPLTAGERVIVRMTHDYPFMAVITPVGTANLDIFELL